MISMTSMEESNKRGTTAGRALLLAPEVSAPHLLCPDIPSGQEPQLQSGRREAVAKVTAGKLTEERRSRRHFPSPGALGPLLRAARAKAWHVSRLPSTGWVRGPTHTSWSRKHSSVCGPTGH